MTEKKRQSTVQPETTLGFNSPAEDELNLIDLLKLIARKKVLTLAVTSVCTLFSIFYVQSITPIYRATVRVIDHNEGRSYSSAALEQLEQLEQVDPGLADQVADEITNPHTLFERFVSNIKSYELKQEVFENGGFQKKFSRETGVDTDQSVSSTYNSIKVIKHDRGVYIELEGSKPKVMLEFLTALVESAKENVNAEINRIQRSIVKTRVNDLSRKKQIAEIEEQIAREEAEMVIGGLHQKITEQEQIEKEMKATEIARFSDAFKMAKRMGIKRNNFDKPDNGSAPLWFRYGELALPNEITNLRSKKEETPNTKSLPLIKLEAKLKLKKFQQEKEQNIRRLESEQEEILEPKTFIIKKLAPGLPLLKFKVATITNHSYSPLNPNQRLMIVGFGVAFGLFISIFMAFLIDPKQS